MEWPRMKSIDKNNTVFKVDMLLESNMRTALCREGQDARERRLMKRKAIFKMFLVNAGAID